MQILAIHGLLGFSNERWLSTGAIKDSLAASMRTLGSDPQHFDLSSEPHRHLEHLQSVAQQLLLMDHTEDADEWFALCMKASASCARADRHARLCLISGLQSLHRHQLRPAWAGLQRALETKGAPLTVVVQACAAMAAMYFQLGMRRPALAAVDRGLALMHTQADFELPRALLATMKVEFIVLDLLRQHERLNDLSFWPRNEEVAGSRVSPADARALLEACQAEVQGHAFLLARVAFLDMLLRVAYGRSNDSVLPMDHLQRLHGEGLFIHAQAARHELALACIAGQRPDMLRQLMQVYGAADRRDGHLRSNPEHDYCLAKLGELNGQGDHYITHYREYARKSLALLRKTCAYITVPAMVRQAVSEIPKDDVASRLSGRYRRAYQFILSNLHRDDLSIRQVAEAVGVTERSLQLAFGAALGQTPSALIRQCRMERIRDELNNGAVGHGTTTMDVGRRWGLRSRSAMSQSYKALFGELPSETGGMARAPVPQGADGPMAL